MKLIRVMRSRKNSRVMPCPTARRSDVEDACGNFDESNSYSILSSKLYIVGNDIGFSSRTKCTKKSNPSSRRKRIASGKLVPTKRPGPSRYTFYSILNMSFDMNRGSAAASVRLTCILLYLILCKFKIFSPMMTIWKKKWTTPETNFEVSCRVYFFR